jgi:hypothetical protein
VSCRGSGGRDASRPIASFPPEQPLARLATPHETALAYPCGAVRQAAAPTALPCMPGPDQDRLQSRTELADLRLKCLTGPGIERHSDPAIGD